MKDEFVDVEGRVKRYWYSDGIAEISVGGMFVLLGLYFGVQGYFGEGSTVGVVLQVSMVLFMIGGVMGVQWLVNSMKTRLTYPRTGYVEYRANDDDAKRRRYMIMAGALALLIASMVMLDFIRSIDSMVLGTGIIIGILFVILRGKSSGVNRFYYLGGFALALGIGLSFDDLSQEYNLALFYGLLGGTILFSGLLVLRSYLSENPMPEEDENG